VNRRELEAHLRTHGCECVRNGAKHDLWRNPATGGLAAVPRHRFIPRGTARGICRSLGIPLPLGF
jgi:predicted RNA binding protein YcfA (HicA-like mRNA interferase family)